ncbi:MAG: glycosyltransferase [bacterium]|nr:glycosyltransferase [bacterium]
MSDHALAIQLVLYKSANELPPLLASLKAQTFQDWELFVFDNSCDQAASDASKLLLEQFGLPFQWTVGETNGGFISHNELFSQHQCPFTFIVNPDIELAPDHLERLMAHIQRDPALGAVTGLLLRKGGRGLDPHDDAVVDAAGLDYVCLGHVTDRFAGRRLGEVRSLLQDVQPVIGVSGSAALFRSEALETSAADKLPFDNTFFMYKEDVDLALRLVRRGYRALLDPSALATHARAAKAGSLTWGERIRMERARPLQLRERMYQNQWSLYAYHLSWRLGFVDLLKTIWHEKKRSLSLFIFGSPAALFRTWGRLVRSRASLMRRRRQLEENGMPHVQLRGRI